MIFTDKIIKLVNEKGMTKNKLLKDIGLNHNSFNDWIKKNQIPNGETIVKIAQYFNVTTDYLLGLTDNPAPNTNIETKSNLTQDEQELLDTYKNLDNRGRSRVTTVAYEELDRVSELRDTARNA